MRPLLVHRRFFHYFNIMNLVRSEVASQQLTSPRIRFKRSDHSAGKQSFVVNRADADVGATVENDWILLFAPKSFQRLTTTTSNAESKEVASR